LAHCHCHRFRGSLDYIIWNIEVDHRANAVRPHRNHLHTEAGESAAELSRGRVRRGQFEEDHVRGDHGWRGVDANAADAREHTTELPRATVIDGESVDVVIERIHGRGGK
jgi:hypothetical protein